MKLQGRAKINIATSPDDADDSVIYETNSNIIEVDSLGNIKAIAGGDVTLTVTSKVDSSIKTDVDVSVQLPEIKRVIENVDSFTNLTSWQLQSGAGTSRVADTVNTADTQSIKLVADKVIAFMRNATINVDLKDKTGLEVLFYVPDITAVSKLVIYISNTTALTVNASKNILQSDLKKGWNKVAFSLEGMTKSAGFDFDAPMLAMQVRVEPVSGITAEVSFDSISSVKANSANVLFTMDDGWISQYDDHYPILKSRNLRGNIGLIKNKLSAIGYMTKTQFTELYNLRWDIFNHTETHPDLSALTKDQVKAELGNCYDWLIANGFERAADITAYPQGKYSDIVLSALEELNFTWGRSLINGIDLESQRDNYLAKAFNLTPSVTADNAIKAVNEAIAIGGTITFLTHKLIPESEITTDAMYWSKERYIALADKVKSEVEADRVIVPTVSELSK
ncbi:polysaccharide deacetylase [Listeria rocourtiae]|uniref:Polysaccharide deacetylase n=1 Tax=Listeria rocourtiae TaxID=647910 RepID=A0A4V6PYN6_9LIST|nr:polysaccharide deacetylase [Listeria rocourtiae]